MGHTLNLKLLIHCFGESYKRLSLHTENLQITFHIAYVIPYFQNNEVTDWYFSVFKRIQLYIRIMVNHYIYSQGSKII